MTLIDWLMKKLGQDYEKRIDDLKEGLQVMANLHAQAEAKAREYKQLCHELERELLQARRLDLASIRLFGMDSQTVAELRLGYIYQTGDANPTKERVRKFFEYLEFKRKEYREQFADRPNPRSPRGPWDMVFPIRGLASHRERRDANGPSSIPPPDGGLVLPSQDSTMLHGDQPAEGETLPPGDPAQPEDQR